MNKIVKKIERLEKKRDKLLDAARKKSYKIGDCGPLDMAADIVREEIEPEIKKLKKEL